MKNSLSYLKKYTKECIFGSFFKLLEAIFELMIPFIMGDIIDIGIPSYDMHYVLVKGAIMIGLGLLGFGCSLTCQYFASRVANAYGRDLRKVMFHHIHELSNAEVNQIGTENLVTIMTTDIDQMQNTVNRFIRLVVRAPFIIIGSIICAFIIHFKLGLVFLVTTVVLAIIIFFIMRPASKRYQKVQAKLDHLSLLNSENISGTRVVRAFLKEEQAYDHYQKETNDYRKESMGIIRFTSLLNPLTYAVIQLGIVALLYLSGLEVQVGNLTQGNVISVINYMNQILLALLVVSNLVILFTKAASSKVRLDRIFALTSSIVSENEKVEAKENTPFYQFIDVNFRYPGSENDALEHITFSFQHGESIGMIGGTGSGKSTILYLMERFYDVRSGQLLVDGKPIQSLSLEDLRKEIAVVDQKVALFKGTIRSNLLMSKSDATDEEMLEALRLAEAYFVFDYKDGLDHEVVEGGKNFSGGQKQRITIARALLRKPKLLILDDATSALDYLTDKKVRENIHHHLKDTTLFFISQRATSISKMDQIIVMDNGEMVGNGTHEELLKSCEVYQEIYESQTKKEVR